MGISVREMLDCDFFREYKVLAGNGGTSKQIQGFAILDAPDGFLWTKGREFALTSGYMFYENPGLFNELLETDNFKKIACLGIKVDRFLKEVPQNIIDAFNELEIPLIYIPSRDSWMDIINAINVAVMNKNIMRFNLGEITSYNFSDFSYKVRKINKILRAVEYEMNFPAMIYDLSTEESYYSSPAFKKLSDGLKIEDFWSPSFNFSREILCANLNMARYRFYDSRYEKPFSWITVPITVDNKVQAYFVVIEAIDLIDYFDQFALRTGFLLIQELYEQLLVARNIADSDFQKFIKNIKSGVLCTQEEITAEAKNLNIEVNNKYYVLIMEQCNEGVILSGLHEVLKKSIRTEFFYNDCRIAYVENNKCCFLIKKDDGLSDKKNIEHIREKALNLKKRLELDKQNIELAFGLSDTEGFVYEINRNYERAEKAIAIGRRIYQRDILWCYSELGPFAWLDIKEDETSMMLSGINTLLKDQEGKELLNVLKIYLECRMNYSLAAKKLYIHINTVRKHIEEVSDKINIDLDNPLNRLKLELLLELFV